MGQNDYIINKLFTRILDEKFNQLLGFAIKEFKMWN